MGLSQKELAQRVGVSARLVAEVERGMRPNVSLETALRMLTAVGVSVRLTEPSGASHEITHPETLRAARAVRAAARRSTWQGRQLRLEQEGQSEIAAPRGDARLAAVAEVSMQAYAVARAQPSRSRSAARSSAGSHKRGSGRPRA
jgi:transcriptional regulator with XRE-family HTH domain